MINIWCRQYRFLLRIFQNGPCKVSRPCVLTCGFRPYGHNHLCILIPFPLGTWSDFKTSLLWLSLDSRDILEQRGFSQAGSEEVFHPNTHYVLGACLPGTSEGVHHYPHFPEEDVGVREEGANSWQSWTLSVGYSDCKALFTKTCCFSAK